MKKENKSSVKEEVANYMREKYNEEFKVVGGGTEGWNEPYEEIYVVSEKFPNASIMVRRWKNDGEMIDNYMDYLMKSEIEDVMGEIVSEIYPESKVFFNTYGSPLRGVTTEMSVDEYIKYIGDNLSLSLTICVRDPNYEINKDIDLEQLRRKFQEREYRPDFTIFYVLDGKLDLINEDNERDLYTGADGAKWSKLRGDFSMDKSYKFLFDRWSDKDE